MWETILVVVLKIVGFLIDRKQASDATKKAFLEFIGTLEKDQLVSSKISQSYQDQLKRLKDKT